MHGLNPQLCQLAGTMVTSGNLEEVIEIVKKAIVYGEEKGGSCSALGFLGTVFHDWVSILWGEGTPNDGMRENVWVLGKYPNDAV